MIVTAPTFVWHATAAFPPTSSRLFGATGTGIDLTGRPLSGSTTAIRASVSQVTSASGERLRSGEVAAQSERGGCGGQEEVSTIHALHLRRPRPERSDAAAGPPGRRDP